MRCLRSGQKRALRCPCRFPLIGKQALDVGNRVQICHIPGFDYANAVGIIIYHAPEYILGGVGLQI